MPSQSPSGDVKPSPGRVPSERPGKVGGKRHENRMRRTRELCDAALELFLQQGIASVTIDEIVAQAHVAKGSFYRYFTDKTQLVESMFEPMAAKITNAFETAEIALSSAEKDTPQIAAAYQRLAMQLLIELTANPKVSQLYLQECRCPAIAERRVITDLRREITEKATNLSQTAIDQGLLRDVGPVLSTLAVMGAAEQLLLGVLEGTLKDTQDAPQRLVSLVLQGLGPASGN